MGTDLTSSVHEQVIDNHVSKTVSLKSQEKLAVSNAIQIIIDIGKECLAVKEYLKTLPTDALGMENMNFHSCEIFASPLPGARSRALSTYPETHQLQRWQ